MFYASGGEGAAVVEAQEQVAVGNSGGFALLGGWGVAHFHGHFFQKLGKLFGEQRERSLDQIVKMRFAHLIGHR